MSQGGDEDILDSFEHLVDVDVKGVYLPLVVETDLDYKFKDAAVYSPQCWAEEVNFLFDLVELIKRGDELVAALYSYRSVSYSFSKMERTPNIDKNEFNMKILRVIEPEVNILVDLIKYNTDSVNKIYNLINFSIDTKRTMGYHFSDNLIRHMLRLLDQLIILDCIKDLKPSLNDDYCYFKQANELSGGLTEFRTIVDHFSELDAFLSSSNCMVDYLKSTMSKLCTHQRIIGLQEFISSCLNHIADWIEDGQYVTPKEKFCLLRCLGCLLYLIDLDHVNNIFKVKTLKWNRIIKIIRHHPIVPVFGDVRMSIMSLIMHAPNFSEDMWDCKPLSDKQLSLDYEIAHSFEKIKSSYETFMTELTYLLKEMEMVYAEYNKNGTDDNDNDQKKSPKIFSEVLESRVYKMLINGINMLSDWTSRMFLNVAWKYSNYCDDSLSEVSHGEKKSTTFYAYTTTEKMTFLELIIMIKSLSSLLIKRQNLVLPVIKSYIHREITKSIQIEMQDILRCALKYEKMKHIAENLIQLRSFVEDWDQNVDPRLLVLKDKDTTSDLGSIPERVAVLSRSNLELARVLIYCIFSKPRKKSIFGTHELSDDQVKFFMDIYSKSFIYPYLINYMETINQVSNLGELWYRELHLDLAKSLQFEIDLSLPWSLIDYIFEKNSKGLLPCTFYPLDIYNDAAYCALYFLKKQHLYREIEAESILAFEQLIYKLSENIYLSYKIRASVLKLDKDFYFRLKSQFPDKEELNNFDNSHFKYFYREFFQILGRNIDLNVLISQRMCKFLISNLKYAIARFEASSITSIIEFENLINCIMVAHSLMSEDGLNIPPWEQLMSNFDNSGRLTSFQGRIILHTLFEIVSDLNPNYVYFHSFECFVKGDSLNRPEENVPRESLPKINYKYLHGSNFMTTVYSSIAELTNTHFGPEHLISFIRLAGKSSLSFLLYELLMNMSLKLSNVIEPYMMEITRGMPQDRTNLPKSNYRVAGLFEHFKIKFIDIANYPPLVYEVFQCFREWGNYLILFNMLDIATSHIDFLKNIQAAPFFGVVPEPCRGQDAVEKVGFSLLGNVKSFLTENVKSLGVDCKEIFENLVVTIENAMEIYTSSAGAGTNFFSVAIHGVKLILEPYREKWGIGAGPVDNSLIPMDKTFEFYRLWSAMQFVFIMDVEANNELNKSSFDLMGDGFLWAGAAIIHFLRQKNRFQAMDFTYYLMDVDEIFSSDTDIEKDAHLHSFLSRARHIRSLNDAIFALLETVDPIPERSDVTFLPPPVSDSEILANFVTFDAASDPKVD